LPPWQQLGESGHLNEVPHGEIYFDAHEIQKLRILFVLENASHLRANTSDALDARLARNADLLEADHLRNERNVIRASW
jgi:hypothetical protein